MDPNSILNVFRFCTGLRVLGSLMVVLVLGIAAASYYCVILLTYGPLMFAGRWISPVAGIFVVVFHCMLGMILWTYCATVWTDPGRVPPGWQPRAMHERAFQHGSEDSNGSEPPPVTRFCRKCNNFKPERTHHCSICGRCVLKMDHHCIWVVNCIGALNYKFFVLFLGYTAATTLMDTCMLLPWVIALLSESPTVHFGVNDAAILILTFVMNFAFALSVLGFVVMHLTFIAKNATTIEALEKTGPVRWQYNIGRANNFQQVFGLNRMYWFVPMYAEEDYIKLPALRGLEYPSRRSPDEQYSEETTSLIDDL